MEICLVCLQVANGADLDARPPRWHEAAELSGFREVARDHPVVMGRRTWESLSGGLPGRQNIVLSSQKIAPRGAMHCDTLPEALTLVSVLRPAKVFLLGGEGLYAQARTIADRIYLARIAPGAMGAHVSQPAIDLQQFALADRFARKDEQRWQVMVDEYRRRRSMH